MIVISQTTLALIDTLTRFSGNKIARAHDLGILLEIGRREENQTLLDEVSFLAKFVGRIHKIMQRIGKEGEGYDTLSAEFAVNLEKVKESIRGLIRNVSLEEAERFERDYLTLSHEALRNLLSLLYDLEWYKNWRIDRKNLST
jgi:hypothetical protein